MANRTPDPGNESEWLTRKRRIDPLLGAAGWPVRKPRGNTAFRTEEEETAHGPADYALWLDERVVGIVEAKKLTIGPQNVLTQAERYARGLNNSSFDFDGVRCPFLYATNGEVIWFHDVRHELNRSRQVKALHTPGALRELLERDGDKALDCLRQMPHDHPRLRPYQLEANAGIENALAERKRNLLVAMATGTGKTFTIVNQIYRLMKAGVAKRILFLVDRRALAAQAVRAFNSFDAEPNKKFTKVYEVYSSRFQREDFGEEERFDPKLLPQAYLTDPQPGHAFVYVATIQRMAVNILGRQAIFGAAGEGGRPRRAGRSAERPQQDGHAGRGAGLRHDGDREKDHGPAIEPTDPRGAEEARRRARAALRPLPEDARLRSQRPALHFARRPARRHNK